MVKAGRLLLFFVLIGLLVSCSASTRYALELDVGSFLTGQSREGSLDLGVYTNTEIYLPDEDNDITTPDTKGYLAEVPGLIVNTLEKIEVEITAALTNQSDENDLSLTAGIYLAPEDENNIYQDKYKIAEAEAVPNPIPPQESGHVSLPVLIRSDDPAFTTVKEGNGKFRIGLKLSVRAETFHYRIERFTLRLGTRSLGTLMQSN